MNKTYIMCIAVSGEELLPCSTLIQYTHLDTEIHCNRLQNSCQLRSSTHNTIANIIKQCFIYSMYINVEVIHLSYIHTCAIMQAVHATTLKFITNLIKVTVQLYIQYLWTCTKVCIVSIIILLPCNLPRYRVCPPSM